MTSFTRHFHFFILTALILLLCASSLPGQEQEFERMDDIDSVDLKEYPMVVWVGPDPVMTFIDLAAYCAPILSFSPDEPLLEGKGGKDIFIPTFFPFEEAAETPVIYYRLRRILTRKQLKPAVLAEETTSLDMTRIDLSQVGAIDLDFFFYYPSEVGLGRHPHDVESVQMKLAILEFLKSEKRRYALVVLRVVAKAHLNPWYDNTLEVDQWTRFPVTIMIEEGKHGSCTDKNADGYYTPGYDVNKRVNDAWGVRDIISSGRLYSSGYQAWMSKVRKPEHRVFPPLPDDSLHRQQFVENGVYAPSYNVYSLRPFPDTTQAEPSLKKVMSLYGAKEWPEVEPKDEFKEFVKWYDKEKFVNSYAFALRADGDWGFSAYLPFFIVKNLEDPIGGGYLVNRLYFKDKRLRDVGYNLLYTPSASRFFDPYLAFGVEWDVADLEDGTTKRTSYFVTEIGMKFRVNLKLSKLRFMRIFGTDFWGLRLGIRCVGGWDIKNLGYVVELGAGVW